MKRECRSVEETGSLARELGSCLKPNSLLCFFGGLGAGKTTFIKGIAAAAAVSPDLVSSPTFVYLNVYPGATPVYHFDLYRLRDSDEFLSMGFDDYFSLGGICCVEWAEKIEPLLPDGAILVAIEPLGEEERLISIEVKGGGDAFAIS